MPYSSADLASLVQDDHAAAVISMEDETAQQALGRTDADFDALVRRSLAAWTAAFGGPAAAAVPGAAMSRILAAVRAAVRRLLGPLGHRAATALGGILGDAVRMGAQQGAAFLLAASGRRYATPAVRAGRALADTAAGIARIVADRRDRALSLLRPDQVRHWSHLLAGIGAGRGALSAVRAHIAWTINQAVNQGLDAVSRAVATGRLWIAEVDACVTCLAYAGSIAPDGAGFGGGLSWDPRQRRIGADSIDGPPLHGFCRCRTVAWSDDWATEGTPFPEALRNEAHRSIAYGTGRPTESRAARLRAARELLRTEPDLLPAVEAAARRAVQRGRFPAAA